MRKKLGVDINIEEMQDLVKEKEPEVDNEFKAELDYAVEFCNGAISKEYCNEIKKQLHLLCHHPLFCGFKTHILEVVRNLRSRHAIDRSWML